MYIFAEGTINIILQITMEIAWYKWAFFHITLLTVALLGAYDLNKLQFEKTFLQDSWVASHHNSLLMLSQHIQPM